MTKKQLKEALISKFLEVASENNYKKQIKKKSKINWKFFFCKEKSNNKEKKNMMNKS
jgi:hypothetical protein